MSPPSPIATPSLLEFRGGAAPEYEGAGQYVRSPIVRDAGNAVQFLAVAGATYTF
jgi:hypothetical protein